MYREYQAGKAITFTWDFYLYAIQQVPTVATISIVNNAGGAVITTQTVGIASDGTLSYTLAAGSVTEEKNYRIDLTYTSAGVEYNVSYLYDVVKHPLRNEVTDSDLFIYLGELRDKVKERTAETSATGSTNYLISSNLTSDSREYLGGALDIFVQTTDTATITHSAKVTAYTQSTGTVTFSPAYTASIAASTTFSIRPSFTVYINNAFNHHVIRDIRNRQKLAGGYIDSTIINTLTIYKTLELYCFSQIESDNDKWSVRYKAFQKNYEDEMERLNAPYDKDEDGNISEDENDFRPSLSNVSLSR